MPLPQLHEVRHSSHFPRKNMNHYLRKVIRRFIKRVILLGVVLGFLFGVYLVGAFAWYSRTLPNPDKILERNIAESTKIYDREGKTVLYDVHGAEKRTLVKIEQIPDYVKWATISAEDKNFYLHHGFNLLAMFKGTIIDPLLGRGIRGGSTLTQQFVKNAILTNERKLSRKIKEFILSYKIEKAFSKDEILQMYLNEIPYGSVSYGVQSASQTFFNKDVKDLTLGEAAILAALPKAPTFYSPFGSNKDRLFGRQQYVLDQMVENKYIDQATADKAKNEKIVFVTKNQSITAPHFVMYVKELLSQELGDEMLESGGLKVITTLDLKKQEAAEKAVTDGVAKRGKQYGFNNAALLSLDPKNGQLLAMVGSKDYFGDPEPEGCTPGKNCKFDGNVNIATSLRQPGSSMKPLVYLAAFQKGYTPNTVLYDVDTIFKTETKDYHPSNYDGHERGPVTMRTALAGSLNIPAVKTLHLTGISRVIDLLELMGYTSFEDRSRFGLALVLGGAEVKLLEHAAAYGILANQGVYNPAVAILKVEDNKGNVLMEFKENSRKVLEPEVVNILTNVISDDSARAYVFGAGGKLTLPGRPVAAKTGTTNDYRDAWTMGYTPSLVAGVWVGNNDNTEMKKGADGSIVAAPIWNDYLQKALAGTPVESFPTVEIKPTGKPVLDGDIAAQKIIKIDKFSGKLATEFTPTSAIVEKTYTDAHNILHYVYKDDPLGAAPLDPAGADSAYNSWEGAVQKWLEKKYGAGGVVSEKPPTEFDNIHIEANKPTIFIVSPSNGATVEANFLNVSVNASAPRGVNRAEYYIDNKLIASTTSYPFDLSYQLNSYLAKGYHKLKARAYDDVDNSNEAEIELNILVDFSEPSVLWQFPTNGIIVHQSSFPIGLKIRLTDLTATQKINFFQKRKETGQINAISTVILPNGTDVSVDWPAVFEKGEYGLYAEIIDPNGGHHFTDTINVIVD